MVFGSESYTSDSDARFESPHVANHSKKRKRLHGACDSCRRKKTKCDSSLMPDNICSNCINCKIECTHLLTRPKKVEPPAEYIQSLEERLERMEQHMHMTSVPKFNDQNQSTQSGILPPSVISAEAPVPTGGSTCPTFLRPVSRTGDVNGAAPPLPVDEDDISDPDDLAHVTLAEKLKNLSVDIVENRFFGKSSMFLFAQQAIDIKNEYNGTPAAGFSQAKRPIFWELRDWERQYLKENKTNYTFPEPDLLATLISLYFEKVHLCLPVLHRPTFERDVQDQLHLKAPTFATVVLAVCAIASRFSDDPRVCLPHADGEQPEAEDASAGWKYISQISLVPPTSLVQTQVHDLQYYALAAQYFLGSSMNHTAWNLAGLGLRLAQDRGLHRRRCSKGRPTCEEELRKRVFWSLVSIDRMMSSFLGRPCALHDEDIDADYPVECDDEFWESLDPSQAFIQPSGKPSSMTAFIHYLHLCEMIGFMLRTLYSTKKSRMLLGLIGEEWELRVVAELDSSLQKWKESLPAHLRWDPNNADPTFFNQSMCLHAAFYYTQIQVHRPILQKKFSLSLPSLGICANAAHSCSEILKAGLERGGLPNPNVMMASFAAATILVINMWGCRHLSPPENHTKDKEDIDTCMKYLQKGENRWHGGARLRDLITEFCSLSSVQAPTTSRQSIHGESIDPRKSFPNTMYYNYGMTNLLLARMGYDQQAALQGLGGTPSAGPSISHFSTSPTAPSLQPEPGLTIPGDPAFADFGGDGGKSRSTVWADAPTAFSIEEWESYISSLSQPE